MCGEKTAINSTRSRGMFAEAVGEMELLIICASVINSSANMGFKSVKNRGTGTIHFLRRL